MRYLYILYMAINCRIMPYSMVNHEIPLHSLYDCQTQCDWSSLSRYQSLCTMYVVHQLMNLHWSLPVILLFIHSFILATSIAPLQALYYSEELPTTARILYR